MTENDKRTIVYLHHISNSAKEISEQTGYSINTVKACIKNNPELKCFHCGEVIDGRVKKFCSKKCRYKWWNSHPELRKSGKKHTCNICGEEFFSQRSGSRYCSWSCYVNSRRAVRADAE